MKRTSNPCSFGILGACVARNELGLIVAPQVIQRRAKLAFEVYTRWILTCLMILLRDGLTSQAKTYRVCWGHVRDCSPRKKKLKIHHYYENSKMLTHPVHLWRCRHGRQTASRMSKTKQMAGSRRPKLTGCVEGMSQIVLAKEIFWFVQICQCLRNSLLQSPECWS